MGCADIKLDHIPLSIGMERSKVEKLVANALGSTSNYSPYGDNLMGGVVEYAEDSCVLEVIYKPGTPAPWVINSEGVGEHLPPIEETVISFRLHEKSQNR